MISITLIMIVIVVLASFQVIDFIMKYNMKVYQALILFLIYAAVATTFVYKIFVLLEI